MQQLSLPLNLLGTEPDCPIWFQPMLETLGVSYSTGWPDRFGLSLRQWFTQQGHCPIRTLSLFSGGGGLDIAFHDCGFEIVQMVELEAKYVQTLIHNTQPGKWLENSKASDFGVTLRQAQGGDAQSNATLSFSVERPSTGSGTSRDAKPICIDIREFFPTSDLNVDFIIGGPPCQTFSAAGRRAAGVAGTSDARGTLFQEYVRILKTLQPKGFLFENVYGITGAQNGEAWALIQKAFKEAGYTIHFRVLDAADYGVPQHRERLFIVGLREGNYLFPQPTHGPDSPNGELFYTAGVAVEASATLSVRLSAHAEVFNTERLALSEAEGSRGFRRERQPNGVEGADTSDVDEGIRGRYGHLLTDIPPGLNYSFYTEEMGHPNPVFSWRSKFSDFLYKADPEMPVRTIKAQGGQYTGPFSWENRRFTIAELKRLQTIPDDYELLGNRQVCIEQIGNSVPPQLGRILALSILEQVMGVKLPLSMPYLPVSKKLGFRQRKRQLTEIYAQKAKDAIANLPKAQQLTASSASTYSICEKSVRFLSPNFAWDRKHIPGSYEIRIEYNLNNSAWTINAHSDESLQGDYLYTIELFPALGYNDWSLPTNQVQLCGSNLDRTLFTALWKAFEEKLIDLTGIADLVQLSGYYQYSPKIKGVLTFNPNLAIEPFWQVVQHVVSGIGVVNQLSAQELAGLWGIKTNDVFSFLQSLRFLGYEVRNHNTNNQIPKGEYLIPYAFPTLTPKSVQLRKKL